MGAPASTAYVMEITFQLFDLEAVVPESSNSGGNKRKGGRRILAVCLNTRPSFLLFTMSKLPLKSKMLSIFSVPWNSYLQ